MTEQIALITGASRGIGKAIALQLAKEGYQVVGTATTRLGADSICEALGEYKGVGKVLQLGDHDNMLTQFDAIVAELGPPSVLVNNAGMTKDNLAMRMKLDEWQLVIDVNLTGVFVLAQQAIKHMMKSRYGRVINMASVVGIMGNVGQANYVAAKAGLIGMTKSLALEVAKRGITVNAIAPGFIETDMTGGLSESAHQSIMEKIPMGHIGKADDIAHAVSYLASGKASYVTGATLHVNGGMTMV